MRILVIEDDPNLKDQIKQSLEDSGYSVDSALDGEEGHFLGDTEPYDAVVLDLGLPKVDGISVLERWRKDKKNFPGADEYVSGNLNVEIEKLSNKYKNLDKFIIGGPIILNQTFELVEEFYLTKIYGNFNCDNHFDTKKIESKMTLTKKIINDSSCHFEIWKK